MPVSVRPRRAGGESLDSRVKMPGKLNLVEAPSGTRHSASRFQLYHSYVASRVDPNNFAKSAVVIMSSVCHFYLASYLRFGRHRFVSRSWFPLLFPSYVLIVP